MFGRISLQKLNIEDVVKGLSSGQFTSVDLVTAYLARIEEAFKFNAVLQVNPDALAIAASLDEERKDKGSRGPLHGVPLLVKDNIATMDPLDASAGSYALLGARPAAESSVIARLRAAGVVILGKTNLSEWANFRGLNISSGWSPRGGQTMGIYYPDSTPEGSSSGSAVAAALGLATAALGTETVGSILEPAEFNCIVGLKPSRGLVGNDGAIPISSRQDVIGILSKTVKDAAYLLSIMAGKSDLDEETWNIPFEKVPNYTEHCRELNLEGIRIGVPRNTFQADSDSPIMVSFESALDILRKAGATVIDNADFPAAEEFKQLNQQVKGIVRSSEFKRDMVKYLRTLETNPNNITSVEDIIKFTTRKEEEEYPERDIGKFLWTQAEGIDVNSDKYKEMVQQERFYGGEGGILGALEKYSVNLLIIPSSLGIANDLAAKMGFPAMTIPLGFYPQSTPVKRGGRKPGLVVKAPGMPYGLTLVTKAFDDHFLLRVGYALEQIMQIRKNGPDPIGVALLTDLKDILRRNGKV